MFLESHSLARLDRAFLLALLLLLQIPSAAAQDAIQPGTLSSDPSTPQSIGVFIPIIAGDDDYDATATMEFRVAGAATWRQALPMLRIRPDTISTESPPGAYGLPNPIEGFAASIFDLDPGTTYEVRVSVVDPDGGGATSTTSVATSSLPLQEPSTPNVIPVASNAELSAAIANARPGDVITLSAGTYQGPISISASGTAVDPIIVRGVDRDTVIIDATGQAVGVTLSGRHLYLEHLTVRGSEWGARLMGAESNVVRHVRFTGVNKGIDGRGGSHRGYYLCDNVLEGTIAWPDVSRATWNEEGIVITGQGHTVCHNTLSGFGDALGLNQNTSIPNIGIDIFGNEVLWTGDDGIELDYAHRNVRAYRNRITNSAMGISVQPGWGGPIYMIRNVLVNQAASPFKFNNEPSGLIVLHNTAVRSSGGGNYGGAAWPQLGYQTGGHLAWVANFQFFNNIVIGTTQPAKFTSDIILGEIDHNGWFPDGTFQFVDVYADLADLKANSPFEPNGRILNAPVFATPPALGADYTTYVAPIDGRLASGANALDAGRVLANVNDGYSGSAPDLGAVELGSVPVVYGVRTATTPPLSPVPNPPENLQVE